MAKRAPYGILAEFTTAEALLAAVRRARQAGYTRLDAFTPYPVEGLAAEIGQPKSRVPFVTLAGGLVGASVGFLMQYFTMAIDYPIDAGGRPFNSWPVFIPITFEVMVLLASFGAFFGMLFLNGLPRLHHPVFSVADFARATQDRFFLAVEGVDPLFELVATHAFLATLEPIGIFDVPATDPGAPAASPVEPPAPASMRNAGQVDRMLTRDAERVPQETEAGS
jgi:hypothetical protein